MGRVTQQLQISVHSESGSLVKISKNSGNTAIVDKNIKMLHTVVNDSSPCGLNVKPGQAMICEMCPHRKGCTFLNSIFSSKQ
jgi:hypothetical protein